ncbi:hypothetical protein GCM10011324_14050 [Allosediminivita pacifica]|uniref:Invasion associated locus B family protein n=2 Tax=Allosediminivita pacifica TaxID=1267769 RepID=A0A2T6AZQ3_9RHOB|nr:hypothetical protein C8N44_107144 [Allosediminivita pacifica]GGB05092.1 hypothetical protein GCM10011324_14050 [Allosediminivita pacifica]
MGKCGLADLIPLPAAQPCHRPIFSRISEPMPRVLKNAIRIALIPALVGAGAPALADSAGREGPWRLNVHPDRSAPEVCWIFARMGERAGEDAGDPVSLHLSTFAGRPLPEISVAVDGSFREDLALSLQVAGERFAFDFDGKYAWLSETDVAVALPLLREASQNRGQALLVMDDQRGYEVPLRRLGSALERVRQLCAR